MGRLSLSAAKIEVDEDQGTGHPRDDWVQRTTLLHQLNIQPGTLHYRIILDTCDRVREHPPQSEDSRATQGSPATSPSTPSRSSENGTRSSTSSSKRPHQQREDSGGNEGGLKRYKTSKPTSGFEHSRALSCLFYKVNPHIYFECANFKAKNVSALGEHLRKRHVGERGHVHCEKCCLVFKTRQERSEHQPKCRSTRGPCVSKILPLERTQGVDAWQRWMKTWDTLFPDLRKPKDPWWSKDIFCEQILLSHRKRQWETGYDSSADLVTEALSEWVASPPEHLPDLQDFEFPIPGHSGNGNRNHTNRLTETSLREAPTSGAAEDPSSTEDTGEEVLGVMQADREPSLGPPVDYLENLRPDKDTSDTIADLGASGITISSPSDNTPSQNVSADTLFDSGWPWELEVQEPQIPLNYTVMDDLIDNPLLESYPHFDARGMDIWDSGSGPGEANAQSLTTDGFVDDNLAGLELGADFFTQTWEDYEYNTGD
ncbi:hypothetical protein F5Y08DRAFT_305739 [Xylaria arbuscula]|nr:hypothetical protein F5Y08DRAFT_305739 [Xylaria arbuscula]